MHQANGNTLRDSESIIHPEITDLALTIGVTPVMASGCNDVATPMIYGPYMTSASSMIKGQSHSGLRSMMSLGNLALPFIFILGFMLMVYWFGLFGLDDFIIACSSYVGYSTFALASS